MALDALKHLCLHTSAIKGYDGEQVQTACDALRDCLAQPEKEWVGLTKEELAEISEFHFHGAFSGRDVYEDIETRLKEKNT